MSPDRRGQVKDWHLKLKLLCDVCGAAMFYDQCLECRKKNPLPRITHAPTDAVINFDFSKLASPAKPR
jgi:hypothetical protein